MATRQDPRTVLRDVDPVTGVDIDPINGINEINPVLPGNQIGSGFTFNPPSGWDGLGFGTTRVNPFSRNSSTGRNFLVGGHDLTRQANTIDTAGTGTQDNTFIAYEEPKTGPAPRTYTMPLIVEELPTDDGRSDLESLTDQRIRDMLSGDWTESLRERQTELTARQAMQARGAGAQRVADAGLTGQGAGVQAMQGIEQDIRQMSADNVMLTEIAEQEAKERGIGYAQNLLWYQENKKQYEDQDWWKEFTYLMQVDPESAGKLYSDKTGRQIDVSTMVAARDRTNIADVRADISTIIDDFVVDPSENNRNLAFISAKNKIKQVIAYDTGRDVSEITDKEAENYFNGLWTGAADSASTQLYKELFYTKGLEEYFDTEKERQIVAEWAIKTVYGGTDENGDIIEGWPMPWEDPETAHWFTDHSPGGGDVDPANTDPNTPPLQRIEITRDGETITVSQETVNTEFDNWFDRMFQDNPEWHPKPGTETFDEWFEHYKNDTLDQWDPMAEINSELFSEALTVSQGAATGNEKLASGVGSSATVSETLKDFIPNILTSIDNGTWEDLYPNIYGGRYDYSESGITDDLTSLWKITGIGSASEKDRVILTNAGNQFVSDNRGKIVTLAIEGVTMGGGPEKFVVLDKLDDSGGRHGLQKIKLLRLSVDPPQEVYLALDDPGIERNGRRVFSVNLYEANDTWRHNFRG